MEEGMGEGEAPADVPLPPMAGAGAGTATPRSVVGGPSAGTVPRGPGAASGGPTAGAAGGGHGVQAARGAALGCRGGCGTALPSCPPPLPPQGPVLGRTVAASGPKPPEEAATPCFFSSQFCHVPASLGTHRFCRPLFFISLAGDPLPHPLPHLFWCVEALNLYQADTHRQLVSAVWRLLVPFNLLIPQPAPFPVPYAPLQMPWSKPEVSLAVPAPPSPHARELRAQ